MTDRLAYREDRRGKVTQGLPRAVPGDNQGPGGSGQRCGPVNLGRRLSAARLRALAAARGRGPRRTADQVEAEIDALDSVPDEAWSPAHEERRDQLWAEWSVLRQREAEEAAP